MVLSTGGSEYVCFGNDVRQSPAQIDKQRELISARKTS